MNWFHSTFFKWTKTPICEICKSVTCLGILRLLTFNIFLVGNTTSNQLEKEDGASNVELYNCSNCNHIIRFPRYKKVSKLLETRLFNNMFFIYFI